MARERMGGRAQRIVFRVGIVLACLVAVSIAATMHHTVVLETEVRLRYFTMPLILGALFASLLVIIDILRQRQRRTMLELAGHREALASINRELEERVAERTRALEAQNRKLLAVQKMEAVGQLAGSIAHDFNNMLTAILGASSYLEAVLPEEHKGRDVVSEIRIAADRAALLTRQLLTFTREQPRSLEFFDLGLTLGEMKGIFRRLCGEGVELELELVDDVLPLHAERAALEQVVVNLVVNACHAMDRHGRLEICAAPKHRRDIAGEAQEHGVPAAVLQVRDNGKGMSPETQARAFEPFFTTKGPMEGTGLGLAAAQQIVERNGGRISLESVEGKGTTVTVALPLASRAARGTQSIARGQRHDGHEHLLLVEDDRALRLTLRRVLGSLGYRVTAAESGEQALEKLAEAKEAPELLITDLMLGGMDGTALSRRVRELHPAMPVLYMTGYAPEGLEIDSDGEGTSVLYKPFPPEQLAARARQLMETAKETEPAS